MSAGWLDAAAVKPMAADERDATPAEIWSAVCGWFGRPSDAQPTGETE